MSATKREHKDQLDQWAKENARIEDEQFQLHGPMYSPQDRLAWENRNEFSLLPPACPTCGQPHKP